MSVPTDSQSSGMASSGFETSGLTVSAMERCKRNLEPRSLGPPVKRRGTLDLNSESYATLDESRGSERDSDRLTTSERHSEAFSNSVLHPEAYAQICQSENVMHSQTTYMPQSADSQTLHSCFAFYGFITAREKEKEAEARRMAEFLTLCERGNLSQRYIQKLLQTDVVSCFESYDSLKAHINSRSQVTKRFAVMCPSEHMACTSSESGSECKTFDCKQAVSTANMYWYRYVSEMIKALCREEESFKELMEGCKEAQKAAIEQTGDVLFDYFDGSLFRRKYGSMLEQWNENKELHVFLTFSSDGFEEFATRSGTRNAWPVTFIVLNYPSCQRFKAGNALIASLVPGSHDSKHFDSFLEPIVQDLENAAKGTEAICRDGKTRSIFIHVLFATFDYPAASKCMGFSGHTATFFCRGCHKTLQHIPEAGGRYAIPNENKRTRADAIRGREQGCSLEWLDAEKPDLRSDSQTRETWKTIAKLSSRSRTYKEKSLTQISRLTGISRVPIVGKLPLDFVHSVPYDPMHLLFLGFIRLLLRLFFGLHPKAEQSDHFVLSQKTQRDINRSLKSAFVGIPSQWGRKTESVEFLSGYKAEDLKTFGLFLGPMVFSGSGISKKVGRLWGCVSEVVHICCDPTPPRKEIEALRYLVQELHALYTDIFYKEKSYSFCFTPTTHAILHLPEMLEECGPLTNVSQFLVERLVGEIGRLIGSKSRPEANLFHKTHTLFSLRLLNGGLCSERDDNYDGEGEDEVSESLGNEDHTIKHLSDSFTDTGHNVEFLGQSIKVDSRTVIDEAYAYLKGYLGEYASGVHIDEVREFKRCRIGSKMTYFDVETESNFQERCRARSGCRQKFLIAGLFDSQEESAVKMKTFYGRVKKFWSVSLEFRDRQAQGESEPVELGLVRIDWQYGINRDKKTGMRYVKTGKGERRGSTRHTATTTEDVHCINRLIGFFDHDSRRYFMDMERRKMETSAEIELGGKL